MKTLNEKMEEMKSTLLKGLSKTYVSSHIRYNELGEGFDSFFEMPPLLSSYKTNHNRYHGVHHLYGVLLIADLLHKLKPCMFSTTLGLMAIAHDYKYDESIKDDRIQVERSFRLFIEDHAVFLRSLGVNLKEFYELKNYLSYPHTKLDEFISPHNRFQIECVRNADLIYSTVFCTKEVLESLYNDYVKEREGSTWEEFLVRNINYLNNLKFDDKGAMRIHNLFLSDAIKVHEELLTYK